MNFNLDKDIILRVIQICKGAGAEIMKVYHSSLDMNVQYKLDNSPVTEADLRANDYIIRELQNTWPEVPIISEEINYPKFKERRQWQQYWLVDPLDGTKEFINRSDEFTVNIALVEEGKPVMGVVYAPALEVVYAGIINQGAWKQSRGERININTRTLSAVISGEVPFSVVASRRHGVEKLEALYVQFRKHFKRMNSKNIGSSLKLCLVAEGKADFYPRLAPTCEWDTAAAQAVVEAAGGFVVDNKFESLTYNQKESILNPNFYVIGDSGFNWKSLLIDK